MSDRAYNLLNRAAGVFTVGAVVLALPKPVYAGLSVACAAVCHYGSKLVPGFQNRLHDGIQNEFVNAKGSVFGKTYEELILGQPGREPDEEDGYIRYSFAKDKEKIPGSNPVLLEQVEVYAQAFDPKEGVMREALIAERTAIEFTAEDLIVQRRYAEVRERARLDAPHPQG